MKYVVRQQLGLKIQLRTRVVPNVVPVQRGRSSTGPYVPQPTYMPTMV